MAKVTKKDMQKEIEAQYKKIKELESKIEILEKERNLLRIKIDWYESLPKQVTDNLNNTVQWIVSGFQPQQQVQQK